MKSLSNEIIRCFIAIELGDQALKQVIVFQNVLTDAGADLKLVEAKNIHITLRFLGEIPLKLSNKISEELTSIQFSPFEVSIQGTGVFPDLQHINVIWVGIERGIVELTTLHNQIGSKLEKLDIHSDNRGFSPHVTVARVRSARNKDKVAKIVLNTHNEEFGIFPVDSIKLKKSILTPQGPVYTTLAEARAIGQPSSVPK